MKQYIKSMMAPLIAIGVLLILYFIMRGMNSVTESYVRKNSSAPAQRVYDYADVLTSSEEAKLEELIAKRETQTGCDIVLVIINEPLREYAANYADHYGYLSEDEYVMVYADNFYDEKGFGYNKPYGDCSIFVDNWDRSDSSYGYAYNWLLTSGRVESKFSDSMIRSVMDDVNERVNDDPYEAYKSYVNNMYSIMSGHKLAGTNIPFFVIVVIALIAAVVYLLVHLSANKGRRTTVGNTYVNGSRPRMNQVSDIFITKNVTKRRIQTSSGGGGGGGHHTTSGGHSVGGGGGHH